MAAMPPPQLADIKSSDDIPSAQSLDGALVVGSGSFGVAFCNASAGARRAQPSGERPAGGHLATGWRLRQFARAAAGQCRAWGVRFH